jgi:Cu-Zn family superoxide dismutase
MKLRHVGPIMVAAIALATVGVIPASAGNGNSSTIGEGPDLVSTLVSPNPFSGARIEVVAAEIGQGNLQVALDVSGVDAPAGTTFGAHVHVSPCGADSSAPTLGAGAHYQDAGGTGPLERREIWLDFTLDAHGRGHAVATRQFTVADSGARSVIIHAMSTDHDTGIAGGRLACTNVTF